MWLRCPRMCPESKIIMHPDPFWRPQVAWHRVSACQQLELVHTPLHFLVMASHPSDYDHTVIVNQNTSTDPIILLCVHNSFWINISLPVAAAAMKRRCHDVHRLFSLILWKVFGHWPRFIMTKKRALSNSNSLTLLHWTVVELCFNTYSWMAWPTPCIRGWGCQPCKGVCVLVPRLREGQMRKSNYSFVYIASHWCRIAGICMNVIKGSYIATGYSTWLNFTSKRFHD